MEGYSIAAEVEATQKLDNFDVAPGPAMAEQQWNGIGRLRGLMEVVDVQVNKAIDLDLLVEVRECIEPRLCSSPVVLCLPYFGKALDFTERCAVVPL
jgi:hypothetical protein